MKKLINSEIQGLRAIAVLAVILVHMQASWLPGGYIGVDVFFVISGYLITSMLHKEYQETNKISFSRFYKRRIRRLFPAMLTTCLLTIMVGFLIFGDEHFALLLDSALSAFFSLSNVYFWSQLGYFDTEAAMKPLLHTWSLGVEEQFYLIWPLLMLFALKNKSKITSIIILTIAGIASFALNWLFIDIGTGDKLAGDSDLLKGFLDGSSTAFYNMPFRIFEFSIGAIASLSGIDRWKIKPVISDLVFLLFSAALIILTFELSEESVFPYYNALWVSLATVAIICTATTSYSGKLLLGNRLMTFLGGTSYSLYLVHWPVIVYYRFIFGDLSNYDYILVVLLTLSLAWALNVWVENRFRYPQKTNPEKGLATLLTRFALPSCLVVSLLLVFLLGTIGNRVPENRKTLSGIEWLRQEHKTYCTGSIEGFPQDIFTCQNNRNSKHTIVVWGDSHGLHLVAGLSEQYKMSNIAIAYTSNCISQSGFMGVIRSLKSERLTQECIERNRNFLDWAKQYRGETVVFISNAKRKTPEQIAPINNFHINTLQKSGHEAFVLGDFIRPGVRLAQCFALPDYIFSDEILNERCRANQSLVEKELAYNRQLMRDSKNYIPLHQSQCPRDNCRFLDVDKRVSWRDHHHLTPPGSIFELSQAKNLINQHYKYPY